ncbi:MAG TPA: DinB family protein [Planctomycetaceae bacterium]|nr:DinB family protein [Planctomycetaceae bacterium]
MTHDVPALCRFMLDYLERIIAEMTPDDLRRANGSANPPGWILGHLAIVADFAGPMLKRPRQCPAAWHKAFGPGSDPHAELPQQTAAEWAQTIRNNYEGILAVLPTADDAELAQPHGSSLLANTKIETMGQLLSHLLTTHLATHIGQLSAWRRSQGFLPLF